MTSQRWITMGIIIALVFILIANASGPVAWASLEGTPSGTVPTKTPASEPTQPPPHKEPTDTPQPTPSAETLTPTPPAVATTPINPNGPPAHLPVSGAPIDLLGPLALVSGLVLLAISLRRRRR